MKRFSLLSSSLCCLFVSAQAFAQMPPPQPAPQPYYAPAAATPLVTDTVSPGLQLNLDVLGFSGSLAIPGTALGGAAPLIVTGSTSSVAAGYYFDSNAILVDLGFAATSGTTILFEIEPAYRRYFAPLRLGAVSPFVQADVEFGIFAPNAGPSDFGIGFGGALGAEWMFTKNIGLEAMATLGYFHLNETTATELGAAGSLNVDTIGLGGKIGLTIHI